MRATSKQSRRRAYIDPPDAERCEHRAFVRGSKETARCGRRKKIGPFCQQHHEMALARVERMRAALAKARGEG